jgi:hypothetical protein
VVLHLSHFAGKNGGLSHRTGASVWRRRIASTGKLYLVDYKRKNGIAFSCFYSFKQYESCFFSDSSCIGGMFLSVSRYVGVIAVLSKPV